MVLRMPIGLTMLLIVKGKDMWKKYYEEITINCQYVSIQDPAKKEDLTLVEKKLKITLPDDLAALLLEMNGDNDFLMSTDQIIENNLDLREMTCYMSLDSLLLFAHNGCGDYFGYPISKDGINEDRIYMWYHETDDRIECASGLKDLITKYYSDEL